jgi:hypothetical protein
MGSSQLLGQPETHEEFLFFPEGFTYEMDNNTNIYLVRPTRGLARPRSTLARGSHANKSSRILNSLQIFTICRSVVIMLVRSGGSSTQCRQDLIVPSLLYPGLLLLLAVLLFVILLLSCSLVRTSP